ncbi:DUF6884 domain-containing protein [Streptomyces sp. V4I23]|uniref:DUF6884 domain-containing protein n=1 Tax=Streptomyces sp. V4I23 TaxID=3042282 RepID=UPI00358E1422
MPCSAAKLGTTIPVPAADLYVGPFHRLCRRAAHAIAGSVGTVLVLSAAHGFLTLGEPLAPYELRMGEPGSVRPDQLRDQAARLGLHHVAQLVALGGRAYVDAVAAIRPDVLRPLDGCRGIGQQRARLSRIAAAEQPLFLAQEFAVGRTGTPAPPNCRPLTDHFRMRPWGQRSAIGWQATRWMPPGVNQRWILCRWSQQLSQWRARS